MILLNLAWFLVWALLVPTVGLFYVILIGGGLLCVPLIRYSNRSVRSITGMKGGLFGFLSGVILVVLFTERAFSLGEVVALSVLGGAAVAALFRWRHSRAQHVSIKPY